MDRHESLIVGLPNAGRKAFDSFTADGDEFFGGEAVKASNGERKAVNPELVSVDVARF